MMKGLSKTFFTGLVTIVPIVVTVYFLYWLFGSAESLLGRIIRLFIPVQFYRPGMGLATGVAIIFFIGLLMHAWIVQFLFDWGERLLYKVPVIKTVYGSIRDFLHFFSRPGKGGDEFGQVVMVPLGETGMEVMGFVTRKNFSDLPDGIGTQETVAVYMPMSYQIGGYTLMVPRSALRGIDMSIEKAMRFTLTGAMTTSPSMTMSKDRKNP